VIRNAKTYAQIRDAEYWRDLSRMSIEESIRLGEDLLTSQAMGAQAFTDDDHPMTLARSLGIVATRKVP
jgi:hypothetical protein